MNLCKDCKHWDYDPTRLNVMGNLFPYGIPWPCKHPSVNREGDATGAFPGYEGLDTGPEFGCIHYQPKDTA